MTNSRNRALITGASSGIGAAFARRLASEGVNLVLVARRLDRLAALAAEFTNIEVETIAADLSSAAGVDLVEQRLAAQPSVDMLINNAGVGYIGPITDAEPSEADAMVSLNIIALTRLSIAAAKAMASDGTGTIVNVASGLAFFPQPTNAVYSGTKAYVLNFTQSMILDPSVQGLTIQCLLPGVTRTEFFDDDSFDKIPAERVMTAEDLVNSCLVGLNRGETVCIPSLPNYTDLEHFLQTRQALAANVSWRTPAQRYSI